MVLILILLLLVVVSVIVAVVVVAFVVALALAVVGLQPAETALRIYRCLAVVGVLDGQRCGC